jgi:hypothetical protein
VTVVAGVALHAFFDTANGGDDLMEEYAGTATDGALDWKWDDAGIQFAIGSERPMSAYAD